MPQKTWQAYFKFNVSPEEHTAAVAPLAEPASGVQCLLWKVWIVQPEEREAVSVKNI